MPLRALLFWRKHPKKQRRAGKQHNVTAISTNPKTNSSVNSHTVISSPTAPVSHLPQTSALTQPDVAERLWNRAYDELKSESSKWVDAYEGILSRELEGKTSATQPEVNKIQHNDPQKRRVQMEKLISAGLEKIESEYKANQAIGQVIQDVLALKNLVASALHSVHPAALAWAGVSVALQILLNPTEESKTNRKGISYIIARMNWYSEMWKLLLKENTVDGGLSANLRTKLEDCLVGLYKALLLYLMKSVCSYYRNRLVNYIQDLVKHNDWEGNLKNVQDAERLVEQVSENYNTQQIRSHLEKLVNIAQHRQEQLVNIARHQEKHLLNIHKAVQDQTALQIEMLENKADKRCLQHLCITDPRDDMNRIEKSKDDLLEGTCAWLLKRADFVDWRDGDDAGLYWIKGGPGKGKTMLVIGIVRHLQRKLHNTGLLSFFFCQNTDPRLNNATAVLRGLIYQLALLDQSLIENIRADYDKRGQSLFHDSNAFFALSRILTDMIEKSSVPNVYLIIDALDECEADLHLLLGQLTRSVSSSRLRCLVSSRPRNDISDSLSACDRYIELNLEENVLELVTIAINAYIERKVSDLAKQKKYSDDLREKVKEYLELNADGTFLWVALVCKQLQRPTTFPYNTLTVLKSFLPGLEALYQQMMKQMYHLNRQSPDTLDYCKRILASVTLAYRPIHLQELVLVAGLPSDLADNQPSLQQLIGLCGHFLIVRDEVIYFVHQSAKDYLITRTNDEILQDGRSEVHHGIVLRALEAMPATLRRDLYGLREPGCSIEEVKPPTQDPLARVRYACEYWIEHLYELDSSMYESVGLLDDGAVDKFIRKHFLHWLEALSLTRAMSRAGEMIRKLEGLLAKLDNASRLKSLVRDAMYFIDYHRLVIESSPLQTYISALIFSPVPSEIRSLFRGEEPSWVKQRPLVEEQWKNSRLPTFQGLHQSYRITAGSPNGHWLASATSESRGGFIEIWDVSSKVLQRTLRDPLGNVKSLAFTRDGSYLASGSIYGTINLWDVHAGTIRMTVKSYSPNLVSISDDCKILASAGHPDGNITFWDTDSGETAYSIEGLSKVCYMTLSCNGQLACDRPNYWVEIWDMKTKKLQARLQHDLGRHNDGHLPFTLYAHYTPFEFSPSGEHLAVAFGRRIWIWCAKKWIPHRTLECCNDLFYASLVYSPTGQYLASGSVDGKVEIWDAQTGVLLSLLEGYANEICRLYFSADENELIIDSGSTVQFWNMKQEMPRRGLPHHTSAVKYMDVSSCGRWLATHSNDATVMIWDCSKGSLAHALQGHSSRILSFAFSPEGRYIATESKNKTIRTWEVETGKMIHTIPEASDKDSYSSIAYFPGGMKIATCSWSDSAIKIWDLQTGKVHSTLSHGSATCLAISQDGSRLASGSLMGTLQIWDLETGELQKTLNKSPGLAGVRFLAFSYDGKQLAYCNGVQPIKVWDLESGRQRAYDVKRMIWKKMSFSPDGRKLFTGPGCIDLEPSAVLRSATKVKTVRSMSGYHFKAEGGEWISWNGRPVIQLPWDYRTTTCIVRDNTAAFGTGTGGVFIFEFDADEIPPI